MKLALGSLVTSPNFATGKTHIGMVIRVTRPDRCFIMWDHGRIYPYSRETGYANSAAYFPEYELDLA